MKLLYEEDKWSKIASALENVNEAHKYDNKYEDADEILEDSKGEIAEKDVDGAISFNPKIYKPEAKPIRQDYKKLYDYAKGIGKIIDEKVDTPFYKAIDEYIQKMADLNVTAYQTANTINVQEGYLFSGAKDKITLNDLYDVDTTYSANLKKEYEAWKLQNPSETASEEDYRTAALNSGAFEYEGIRAGQEKKELWFNLIAAGVVIGLAIVCPPAGLAAGVIYTAIDVGGAVKGEDLISGRKLSDEERLTRGAFAIVPAAGGLAAKSLLKHMPALATVMKIASKTVDDAIKPIKNTVENIALSGKQSVKTAITKTQQKVSTIAVNSMKSVRKSVEPVINEAKQRTAIKAASTKSGFSTKVENAIKLGKAHVDQLKFAVAHPTLSTVTSKAGQKSIRGTAKFIDDALRPAHIKSMEVIGGPKIPVGIERGPSKDVLKNKGEDLISKMQVKKDAIKGSKGTGKESKIDIGKTNIDALRKKWNVPETETVAVGKTDVKGLEDLIFEGGSPKVRKEAGLPDLDEVMPDRNIKAPGTNPLFTRHAEEGVLNEFDSAVIKAGIKPEDVTGTLKLHQSNPSGVCRKCYQGLANDKVPPGVLKQLSLKYPYLKIEVTSEIDENIKVTGRLNLMIKNGNYID